MSGTSRAACDGLELEGRGGASGALGVRGAGCEGGWVMRGPMTGTGRARGGEGACAMVAAELHTLTSG